MLKKDLLALKKDYVLNIKNDKVELYHATTKENAEKIIKTQLMYGKENGIFFSNLPDGEITGYGNTVLKVKLPIAKLELDDQFNHELHFRFPCKPNTYYPVIAHRYVEVADEIERIENLFDFLKEHQKHTIDDLYDKGYYNALEFVISKYEQREPNFKKV